MITLLNSSEDQLMKSKFRKSWMISLIGGLIVTGGAVLAADRTAEQILSDIDAVAIPQPDRAKVGDRAYVQEFMTKRQEAMSKRAGLIRELYRTAPKHERIATLLP